MNKLFTKIATLSLGLAMAIGVGVAVGSKDSREVARVDAVYTDATMAAGSNSVTNNTINSHSTIKAGTSSKAGSMTITLPNASGATTLSIYIVAWSGDSKSIKLSATSGVGIDSTLAIDDDANLSGSGTSFTLANSESTYLKEISLTNAVNNTVITLTSKQASKSRFFVWSPTYDNSGSPSTVFDITYDANNGSGVMAGSKTDSTASACTFVPVAGYRFSCWNTKADGTGADISVGDSLSDFEENTTLYAKWAQRTALQGTETLTYQLTCNNELSNTDNTSYTTNYDVVCDEVTWNAPGNQNNATYWRIGGGKNSALSDTSRTIHNKTQFHSSDNSKITKVVFNHGGISNSKLTINYLKLEVNSDNSFAAATAIDSITYTPAFSVGTSGSITFIPSQQSINWADGSYYRFTINCTTEGTGSNYGLDVNSIQFYYDYVSSDYASNLTVSPTSITPDKGASIADAVSELTVTAQVNGAAASAYTNYSVSVTRRDDSIETVTASTVFKTGDKKITITALDPSTQGGSAYESFNVNTTVSYTSIVTIGNKYALTAVNTDDYVFAGTVTNKKGDSVTYSSTPSEYAFVVEDGYYSGSTVSFKLLSGTNAGKYISWTGTSAELAISDTKTALASWIAFDDSGVNTIANANNESGLLMMNPSGNKFNAFTSSYTNYKAPSFYLLGTTKTDAFALNYMKMESYDPGGTIGEQGKGDGHSCVGYYATAKLVFNGKATGADAAYNLSGEERALICDEDGLYADTYLRLTEWARINGDSINGSTHALESIRTGFLAQSSNAYSTIIIVVISLVGVAAIGGYFLFKKKKHN